MTISDERKRGDSNYEPIEFTLTAEIKALGIERVYTDYDERLGGLLLCIRRDGMPNPVRCIIGDKKGFKKISKEIEMGLSLSGFDKKSAKKFIVLFSIVWIKTEQERKKSESARIIEEIQRRRQDAKSRTVEEWQAGVLERYQTLQRVIKENAPEIWAGLEFELSVFRILNILGCTLPCIGIILARPGGWKTQIIKLLAKWHCAYYTDDFTPRSFISHSSSVSKEELEDIDMLPKLNNKIFLTPELAPMFTAKDEDLLKMMGIITRIADGDGYASSSGAQGDRRYDSIMFTWVGSVVIVPYKVYKLLGNLGFKLYFFRLPFVNSTEDELLAELDEDFNENIEKITTAFYEYLYYFETGPHLIYDRQLYKVKWDKDRDSQEVKKWIVSLGVLLQHLRCIAKTWEANKGDQGSDYAYAVSQPEAPGRAIRMLMNIARGHALSQGRNYVTMEDVPIAAKTVLSTCQLERCGVFFYLIKNHGDISTSQVMSYLNVMRNAAKRTMAELTAIGLVERYEFDPYQKGKHYEQHIRLKDEFCWCLKPEFKELYKGFRPVDDQYFERSTATTNTEDPYNPTKYEKIPPSAHEKMSIKPELTEGQITKFWSVFKELEAEQQQIADQGIIRPEDRDTISGESLKKRLIDSLLFSEAQAVMTIIWLDNCGAIDMVSYDTYKRGKGRAADAVSDTDSDIDIDTDPEGED